MNILLKKRMNILSKLKETNDVTQLTNINKEIVQFILNNSQNKYNTHVKDYYESIIIEKQNTLKQKLIYFTNLYDYLKDLQNTEELKLIIEKIKSEIKEIST
jgi:uncharacterized protein YeeX (DUF496 family)